MVMDWDSDYPQAAECLVAHPDKPADWNITHKNVWLSDVVSGNDSLDKFTLVVTTGHGNLTFTDAERVALEQFVSGGGILWFDDCGGVQIDNFPFGLEIDFAAEVGLPAWGLCYGDNFTVKEPNHPLVNNLFVIPASAMRSDPGLATAQWFTPMGVWDPAYHVVVEGKDVSTYGFSGPALIANRHGKGKIVATAMDVTCALECVSYGLSGIPKSDYDFIFNMLAWQDSDGDNIYDRDEGAFTSVDTDTDAKPDYLDSDTDGDSITDLDEAGDVDVDTPPIDTDKDGTPDFRDTDSDGDGIDDKTEHLVDSNLDGFPNPDVDGDGKPNQIDDDTDGDGKPDSVEGTGDDDGDTIPNFADADDNTPKKDAGASGAGGSGGSGNDASIPSDGSAASGNGGAGGKKDGGLIEGGGASDGGPNYNHNGGSAVGEEGGCGCRTSPGRFGFAGWSLLALAIAGLARRRR